MKLQIKKQVEIFNIIECEFDSTNEKIYKIALGKTILPIEYTTEEDAEKAIKEKNWEVIGLFMETFANWYKNKKSKKN